MTRTPDSSAADSVFTMPPRPRAAFAADRRAENEWLSADEQPKSPMWVQVRSSHENATPLKRILFNGRYFMTREPFSAWKACPEGELPVSSLVESRGVSVLQGLEVLELEDTPDELGSIAELARMELKVDVVRMFRPGDDAAGALSGRVLATSKMYAAQQIGDDSVVIHEQSKLDRRVHNGETVTLDYANGRAKVYNGVFFDVNINAPFLTAEQRGWMRMQMIEALSGVDGADKDDEMVREALRYALDRTTQMFGMDQTRLDVMKIRLTVTDPVKPLQLEEVQEAERRAAELSLVPIERLR